MSATARSSPVARIAKDAISIPAHGRRRTDWDAGERSDFAPAKQAGSG